MVYSVAVRALFVDDFGFEGFGIFDSVGVVMEEDISALCVLFS